MKRSERLHNLSLDHGLMAATIFCLSLAIGAWSAGVWITSPAGGLALMVLALAGLFSAALLGIEARRLARLARTEARWEWEREVRPRL